MMSYAFKNPRALFDAPLAVFQAELFSPRADSARLHRVRKIKRRAALLPWRLELGVLMQDESRVVARRGQQLGMHGEIREMKLGHAALLRAKKLAGTA